MARVGDVLESKYRLVKVIGQGGMGEVFEAEHLQIGKRVAVKVLRNEAAKDDEVVARFTRGARAAAAVGHKSIIDVYDIGQTTEGQLFQVMEFLEGESLGYLLARTGRVELHLVVYVACQVLSALDAAHRAGIVHRDLKPDNIYLVETRHSLPDVRLLDFGISKMLDPKDPEDRLTETGIVLGTPYYMAPEQAQGVSTLDHRVDIYAMGVILYECLTGRVPFVAKSAYALITKILTDNVIPPSQRGVVLPPGLESIVLCALERFPDDRYDTAAEMLTALLPFNDEQATVRISVPGVWQPTLSPPTERDGGIGSPQDEDTPDDDEGERATEPGEGLGTARTLVSGKTDLEAVQAAQTQISPVGETAGATGSFSRRSLTIGGAIVVIGALVVGGYVLLPRSSGDAGEDVTRDPVDEGPGSAGEQPGAGGSGETVVVITLEGVPAGAQVYLDDSEVDGTELRLHPSAAQRPVRVELAGYLPWRRMIEVDESRSYAVRLVARGAHGDGGAESGADAEPTKGPVRPGPGKTPRRDGGRPSGSDGPTGVGLGLDTTFPSQGDDGAGR